MRIGEMDPEALAKALRAEFARVASGEPDPDPIGEEVESLMAATHQLLETFRWVGGRSEAAAQLIDQLIPTMIDESLWRNLATGKNIQLPITDQYGPISARLAPSDAKVAKPPKGNVYGRVHSKGDQAPSDFMKRQGKEVENATRRVLKLEEELEAARQDRANLEHGLKLYAATCLVTAMQQATASIFAAGPAWTLLCAIRASSGDEVTESQSTLETQRILVILHALRGSQSFHRDLKAAILAVCHKHEAAARQQGKVGTEFDGPIDYDAVLDDLEWLVRKDGCYCHTRTG